MKKTYIYMYMLQAERVICLSVFTYKIYQDVWKTVFLCVFKCVFMSVCLKDLAERMEDMDVFIHVFIGIGPDIIIGYILLYNHC